MIINPLLESYINILFDNNIFNKIITQFNMQTLHFSYIYKLIFRLYLDCQYIIFQFYSTKKKSAD